MKKYFCLFIGLMIPFISFSQVKYSIQGKIVTYDGEQPTGNVLVLQPSDSTFITGTSFFEEDFRIDNIEQTEILLKFTSLQFSDTILSITHNGAIEMDLGEIIISALGVNLETVVIKGRRPIYVQKPNGTVEVVIENTTLAASNSVSEILSKSPEVLVEGDGVTIFGKGNAVIFLDGKRIQFSQLALIPPANIKKMEIIRNPSSKYDSDGGAVINITTIKQRNDGYKGNIRQNVSYSEFGNTNAYSSFNLSFKKGRFSSNANYSIKLGTERELLTTTRNRQPEDVFLTTDLTTDWDYDYDNFSNYGLGLQYDIDDKSYLSAKYSGFYEGLGGNVLSDNTIVDDIATSLFESNVAVDEKGINNSISLNYNKNLDTLGSTLFIGGQYSRFDIVEDNFITEKSVIQSNLSTRFLKTLSNLNIDIYSSQMDYTKNFKNKSSLELGAKYSFVENDFDFDFLVSNDGIIFGLEEDLSNEFNYLETIGAVYFNFKNSWNKINYAIGMRAEYTHYNLTLSQVLNKDISDKYFSVFPNLSITRLFSDDLTLNFSYSSRINRPAYQTLNPILIYQDPYTSISGNPELTPEIKHAFEIINNIKKLNIKVGYTYTDNAFAGGAIRGEESNTYVLTAFNAKAKHELYTSFSRTFSNDWFTSTNTLSFRYTKFVKGNVDFEEIGSNINPYLYSNNRFKISDSFYAEILFWGRGRYLQGLYDRRKLYNLTFTLEKSFFNKSLECRLIANDIFHKVIGAGNYNIGQTDIYFNRRWTTNYFRLSFSYNFGKLKKSNYRNKSTGASENSRAN